MWLLYDATIASKREVTTQPQLSVAPRLPDVGVDCSAFLSCGMVVLLVMTQALTLGLWVQWPGGPVDLKTYWPPKKLTGPPKNLLVPTSKPNLRDEKLFA